jgi:hypothetical protein
MDIAHCVALLTAHGGVLDAEISRIDADTAALRSIQDRYGSSRPTATSVSSALESLRALRAVKQQQLDQIRQQLELFRLHLPAAQLLLGRLKTTQKVDLPASTFPHAGAGINAIVESQILAPVPVGTTEAASSEWAATTGNAVIVTPARFQGR